MSVLNAPILTDKGGVSNIKNVNCLLLNQYKKINQIIHNIKQSIHNGRDGRGRTRLPAPNAAPRIPPYILANPEGNSRNSHAK